MVRSRIRSFVAICIIALLALGTQLSGANAAAAPVGAVYVITNSAAGNAVLVWDRASDGSLTPAGSYLTGGKGSAPTGLGSQSAIVLSENGRYLFTVDAGSNQIASFRVTPGGLELVDHVASGGIFPNSLTVNDDLLYVLNAGTPNVAGTPNITGFTVRNGRLRMIPNSARPLSGAAITNAAQVAFSPDGDNLVVTEKATNKLDVYSVGHNGRASGPTVYDSSGATPFGFAFGKKGTLVVSEAAGAPGASAASSYRLKDGKLTLVTGSLSVQQRAACWAVVTSNGRFAYTANAGSASVSSLAVGRNGELTLLNPAAGATAAAPTDMALSAGDAFLYVRAGGGLSISAFAVNNDGSLTAIPGVSLPAGEAGLAVR
jgi:6-phosphogluconolactonase (cycloisomerase 2 family)